MTNTLYTPTYLHTTIYIPTPTPTYLFLTLPIGCITRDEFSKGMTTLGMSCIEEFTSNMTILDHGFLAGKEYRGNYRWLGVCICIWV